MLPAGVRQWQAGGRMLATRGGEVFVRSSPGDGPTVLLLHGFPSSSYDFREVTERLGGTGVGGTGVGGQGVGDRAWGDRAWLTLDFLGFGLSDKPRPHRYSLFEQADIVEQVVAATVSGPVVLVAHDMGTSVATELLARDLTGRLGFDLRRAVLTNGSVIIERASLRPSQKILCGPLGPLLSRLANQRSFLRGFGSLFQPRPPAVTVRGRRPVGADRPCGRESDPAPAECLPH